MLEQWQRQQRVVRSRVYVYLEARMLIGVIAPATSLPTMTSTIVQATTASLTSSTSLSMITTMTTSQTTTTTTTLATTTTPPSKVFDNSPCPTLTLSDEYDSYIYVNNFTAHGSTFVLSFLDSHCSETDPTSSDRSLNGFQCQ